MDTEPSPVVRFGVFEADLRTGELRRTGLKVRLQEQPFRALAMLLERPGDLVTRDELRRRLWPDDVFVDFEHNLNKAVNKIRRALGDSAENPRFVETLARRGYRFVAPVEGAGRSSPRAPAGPFRVIWDARGIPLSEGVNVLGRDPEAAVSIDSSTVSRRHARIVVSGGSASLEDLGSKNGTFLNGRPIEGSSPLADGDEIRVGSARLVFRAPARTGSTRTDAHR